MSSRNIPLVMEVKFVAIEVIIQVENRRILVMTMTEEILLFIYPSGYWEEPGGLEFFCIASF